MTWLIEIYNSLFVRRKTQEKDGLGTFMGVFIPSLLLLFGVIIFLRLGWIVGQVGLVSTIVIISVSALVALFSALSMAAIATNIKIGKGGVYYILSRSLGLDIGAAVGLPLYLKQTLCISFCVVGFAESLHDLIPTLPISYIGVITTIVLAACALRSTKGALKVQVVILALILLALASLFTGGNLLPAHPDTFTPQPLKSIGFWAVFAIFFPAMTGLESSVSLSGDLRNPCRSLPLGTMLALVTSYVTYIVIALFLAQHVPLERLAFDPLILQDVASIPSLIVLGIWGTTLSSALAGLITAPRTLQAIADDGVIWRFFGKTYGKDSEPRIAIFITFLITLAGVYFGSINVIAPLLTMICLICYTILNLAAGFETLMANPSFRPRFRLHWSIPMLGAVVSLLTMLMIDPGISIIASTAVVLLYIVARYRNLHGSWDDIQHGIWMFLSRFAIYHLAYEKASLRCWRPHFLVFTSRPDEHSNYLMSFSQAISQNKGFLTMASFVNRPLTSEEEKLKLEQKIGKKLKKQKVQALVQINHAPNVVLGMHSMIETYGLGPLMPNTIVFGGVSRGQASVEIANLVDRSYKKHCNVVILSDPVHNDFNVSKKDLHVWWDDENEANTKLMLILAYMLQRNKQWKKGRIWLKSTAPNEWLKKEKLKQFQNYAEKKRFHLETEVFVSPEPRDEYMSLVTSSSQDAGIVFLSLRRLQDGETLEEYAEYLQSMTRLCQDIGHAALVLSSEHTPLHSIMQ